MNRLLRRCITFALVVVHGAWAFAQSSFTSDGLTYCLDADDFTASVTACDPSSDTATIPENVTMDGNTYTVTNVDDACFSGCTALTAVSLPNTLTSLGYACFQGCTGLTKIDIPTSIRGIGKNCFANCSNLAKVYMRPTTPPMLGGSILDGTSTDLTVYVFSDEALTNYKAATAWNGYNFINLDNVTIGRNRYSLDVDMHTAELKSFQPGHEEDGIWYYTEVNIPEIVTLSGEDYTVTKLGDYCCKNEMQEVIVEKLNIPTTVTTLGKGCFSECWGIHSISIPSSVTSIGDECFSYCYNYWFREICIPNSVKSIGDRCFAGCSYLERINLPDTLSFLGSSCFSGCEHLSSITIPNGVIELKGGGSYDDGFFSNCYSLKTVILPNSLTRIGPACFYSCRSLETITLPCVEEIDYIAFGGGCTNLKSLTLPKTLVSIHEDAFGFSASLENLGEITVEEGNPIYDSRDNCNAVLQTSTNKLLFGCKNTIIPNTATSIIKFCSLPSYLVIPENITSIASCCFTSDERQISLVMFPTTPPEVSGESICNGDITPTIYVPTAEAKARYQNTEPWSNYEIIRLDSVAIGNLVYSLDVENYTATVVGYNPEYFNYISSIDIPSEVECIEHTFAVMALGKTCFKDCANLKTVTIPASVAHVDGSCFAGCTALKQIEVNENNPLLDTRDNCNAVIETATNTLLAGCKNSVIPASVTALGDSCFYGCTGLRSISIPKSVTKMGTFCFAACTNLEQMVVEADNPALDSRRQCNAIIETATHKMLAGCKNTKIPTTITSIEAGCFAGCTGLTDVTVPKGVTFMGGQCFMDCSGLTAVTMLPTLPPIVGEGIFDGATQLSTIYVGSETAQYNYRQAEPWKNYDIVNLGYQSLSPLTYTLDLAAQTATVTGFDHSTSMLAIPASIRVNHVDYAVTGLGNKCFAGSEDLTTVSIPHSLVHLGDSCFTGCYNLADITVDAGNPVLDSRDNCRAIIVTATNEMVLGCQQSIIPGSVTSLADECFAGCIHLTSITLPSTLTQIGNKCFYGCTGLSAISIPAFVTTIGSLCFTGCSALETITVDAANTVFDAREQCNAIIETATNKMLTGCKRSTIPYSVTALGNGCFFKCQGLTDIEVPSSVNHIGDYCFYGCSELTSIMMWSAAPPATGDGIFSGAENLRTIYVSDEEAAILYKTAQPWNAYNVLPIRTGLHQNSHPANTPTVDVYYDLNGQRLMQEPPRGTFIKNGQTVVK